MAPIPPPLLRRALILDVVLTLLMLGLSLMADQQLWRVIWSVGALVAVLDALLAQDPASRVACETVVNTGLCMITGAGVGGHAGDERGRGPADRRRLH